MQYCIFYSKKYNLRVKNVINRNTQYTHAGDTFAKAHFFARRTEALCVICSQESLKKYSKLSIDLGYDFCEVTNYHELSQMLDLANPISYLPEELLHQKIHPLASWKSLTICTGKSYESESIIQSLIDLSYVFDEYQKPGSYCKKGDILTITLPDSHVLHISFWGDEIESITHNGNTQQQSTIGSLEKLTESQDHKYNIALIDVLCDFQGITLLDELEFSPHIDLYHDTLTGLSTIQTLKDSEKNLKAHSLEISPLQLRDIDELRDFLIENKNVSIYSRLTKVIENFLSENNLSHISMREVQGNYKGFQSPQEKILCDDSIAYIFVRKRVRKSLSNDVDLMLKINPGDHVVHIDHGIGTYIGICEKDISGIAKKYLEIRYQKDEKLFVPLSEVHRLSKYVGSENPQITPLGGKIWEKKMKKVHEDIREIAENILQSHAERKVRSGNSYSYQQDEIRSFQEAFPYTYTLDQADAIDAIFGDMTSDKNMDRLVVGDVGFGKTEIAFNAAFLAAKSKRQVLLISPLVVLAHEHYHKALERFSGTGLKIGILTRLQTAAEANKTIQAYMDGAIDILIGTHRLLSPKISSDKLGLLIVDEEHKFGVADKEKIKSLKANLDILSLSATPIPRSLNMALSGIRDISLLKIAPKGRKSIKTAVLRYNENAIIDACRKEFDRDGQVFFVHNRVENIMIYEKQLKTFFPKKKIIVTHGRLSGDELENRIIAFKNKEYDILLSTTVIENGIDFSNVNTIFINECQSFGISQIHQLRGRVGRSDAQGYCYLLYRHEMLSGESAKRIQTIVDYSYLGAGFELAMKDLEIRGGGDILGVRQSGQAKDIGVSLFLKMLEEKITELKQEGGASDTAPAKLKTQIDLMIDSSLPQDFFSHEADMINFYRELQYVDNIEDLMSLKTEFTQSYSQEKDCFHKLFLLLECQILAATKKIEKIKKVGNLYHIEFANPSIDDIKYILSRDNEVKISVLNSQKLKAKGFESDEKFVEYLTHILRGERHSNSKFRLKHR